ncbi:phospholipid-binding protein MlaC [Massilia sp. Mn16-1_5]|uniref:MlaC/ttg2D family ABC transporter substrate-binding protein n=1 Tax=Massilia sp. Mn16-1_5 TaxID=2079199 RepID=UPI00109EB708|nr:ABC transporter substrate-binding protein [Massilia sp. Mn16-1_5]THC46330.1 ABC transporter [Massilia sp. Mn16-1_5]
MKPIILSLAMLAPALPASFGVLVPAHAQQTESQSPHQAVKSTIERVMSAIRSDPGGRAGDPDRIYQLVQQHFLPATDFALTTRYAVGDAWASATPAQREALVKQFQTLLARTFALQLTQIHEQDTQFTYAPVARPAADANDAVVKTSVRTEGERMPIDYRLRKTGAGWKIYDINMMGAWMIQVYRKQFAAQLASGGVDGLIKYLAAHNAAV